MSFVPVASTLVSAARLGIRLVDQRAILVREILFAAVEFEFAVGAERGHLLRADRQFDHAGVEVLDENAVGLVILGLQAERVGLDAEVDVLGDEDGGVLRLAPSGWPVATARMRLSTVLPWRDRCRSPLVSAFF